MKSVLREHWVCANSATTIHHKRESVCYNLQSGVRSENMIARANVETTIEKRFGDQASLTFHCPFTLFQDRCAKNH